MVWQIEAERVGITLPPGFSLEEDEDYLYLKFDGKKVATFSSRGVEPIEIMRVADQIWNQDL